MRRLALWLLVFFLASCTDEPTAPTTTPSMSPEILDAGALGDDGTTRANRFIQFAPPVVSPAGFERLDFTATTEFDPVVEVCELTDASAGTPQTCVDDFIRTYTRGSGGILTERVLDGLLDNYVIWVNLRRGFDTDKDYRFFVRVGEIFGGFADLRFVNSFGQLVAEWRGGEYAPVTQSYYPFRFILYEGFTGCGAFPEGCSETPVPAGPADVDGSTATYQTVEPTTVIVGEPGQQGAAQVTDGAITISLPDGVTAPEELSFGAAFLPSASPCLHNVTLADPFLLGDEPEVCFDIFLFDPATGRRFAGTLPAGSALAYCAEVTSDPDIYSNGSLPSDVAEQVLYMHEDIPQPVGFPGSFGPGFPDCSSTIAAGPFPKDGSLFDQGRWVLQRGLALLGPQPLYALNLGFVHGVTVLRAGDINVLSSYPRDIAVVDQAAGAPAEGTLESAVPNAFDLPQGSTLDLTTVAVHHADLELVHELVPETFDAHNISWTSDNVAVATVHASTGLVTAVSPGSAVITATVLPYVGSTLREIRVNDGSFEGLPITDDVTVNVTGVTGLLLHYPFDGDANNVGQLEGYDGVETNVTFPDGKFGQAIKFDGEAETGAVFPGTESVFGFGGSKWTISLWFREDTKVTQTLLWRFRGTNQGWETYHGVTADLMTTCSDGGCDSFASDEGVWHSLVYRYDGVSATEGAPVDIYVDGVLEAQLENADAIALVGSGVTDIRMGGGILGQSEFFIDDFRVYNQVFSSADQCTVVIGGTWNGESCVLP